MLPWIIILGLYFGNVYGGTCREAYGCTQTCYRRKSDTTACGFFNWDRCSKYRSKGYSCGKTCYRTVCCTGYTGNGCNTPICFGSTSCQNGGTCQSPDSCRCPTGFSSPKCNDMNECNTNNGDCEQICRNNMGSYTCDCSTGYELNADGKTCSDVNECIRGTSLCAHVCSNSIGSYICTCHTGYALAFDRKKCEDIDECSEGSHQCKDYCNNTPGSYTCYCGTGFEESSDDLACLDVDECSVGNGNCDQICINQPGSYKCECYSGYRMTADSLTDYECQDIDECREQISGCSQICTNVAGSYTCSCNTGYFLNDDNRTCLGVDNCEDITCDNGGFCKNSQDSFICICDSGFTGMLCQTDINECELFNGGCQDICINTIGSFKCNCSDGKGLQADEFSCVKENPATVFERLKIPRLLLPEACFTVKLFKCTDGNNIDIYLTSTSEWYRLNDDTDIIYTLGIVFVKVSTFSVPVSLQGIEVTGRNEEFVLNYGVHYDSSKGTIIENDLTPLECTSFELVESDVFDFINADSFTKTLLLSLHPALPDWLKFEKSNTEILSVQDVKTDFVYGRNMDDVIWCSGAPVLPDHLYIVFRFDTGFTLRVLGNKVDFPKPLKSRKFCLIVDLCQSYGGTVFLMIPEESRDLLLNLSIFQTLKEEQNIHIQPTGVGISLVKGIKAAHHTISQKLWNGDLMFLPPWLSQVDFWIGGKLEYDKLLVLEVDANIYFAFPNVQTMLTSMFREEWTGSIDIQVSRHVFLRFKLFGKDYLVPLRFLTGSANAYMSIGGSNRQWCGEVSNPEGVFLSALIEINPFKGVPFLEDFVISFTNRLYAFLMTDPHSRPLEGENINIHDDILALDNLIDNTVVIINDAIDHLELFLSNSLEEILVEMKQTAVKMQTIIRTNLVDLLSGNFTEQIGYIEEIRQSFYQLTYGVDNFIEKSELIVYNFVNETGFLFNEVKYNLTELFNNHIGFIRQNIKNIYNEITRQTISSVENFTGFGLKYTTDLKIFGVKLIGLDIEIVYSEGNLFRCSRFDRIRKLLDGEKALRFLGRASSEYVNTYILGYFLKYEDGFGIGGALALHFNKAVIQLQTFANILGIKQTVDLFISIHGIYFYLEGNVWDIFLAQIDVSAEAAIFEDLAQINIDSWYKLTFNLRGRFVAKARTKRRVKADSSSLQKRYMDVFQNSRMRRQVQTVSSSFQDSYLDALKTAIRMISEEAQKRLFQAQAALTASQTGLTKAQNWFDEKQTTVKEANTEFDNAVKSLETANKNVEAAKEPLRDAIKRLEEAQINIDNLCKIRKCSRICIPGMKCKLRRVNAGWLKFKNIPSCRYKSCFISFPDPICVISNKACRIVRAAAYLVLEKANIFVRAAMLAFDIAKATVAVAEFVVDKSRFVLTIAEEVLEIAELGLEVARGILEAAKIALQAIKSVIGTAVKVLEFVIQYGLENIIDVGNCQFNIELSTKDLPVFEVHCDVNAFRLGWMEFRLKINFKNILQSIWQAAKATVKAIIGFFGEVFNERNRRDVEFDAFSRIHILLRSIRETNGLNNTDTHLNKTIDIVNNITGFRDTGDSDLENRIQLFREKCSKITVINEFMQHAFESLQDILNESKSYLRETEHVKKLLQEYSNMNELTYNMTVENVGISKEYAAKDYNMTGEDLDKVINQTNVAVTDDPLLVEIISAANISMKSVVAQSKSIESVDFLSSWLTGVKNMTLNYFNKTECYDFKDCVFFSISSLYDLYENEDLPNITNIKESILDLENILIETFQNESSSLIEVSVAIEHVLNNINDLVEMNSFCAEPPEFLTPLRNQTVLYGSDVQLFCVATGDPEPSYTWLKNDTILAGESSSMITIINVTDENVFDKYNCMVGNVVANITSDDAYITVVLEDEDECQIDNGNCNQLCNNTIGSYVCSCYEGYRLQQENRFLCTDINECETFNGGCTHTCTNKEGSFVCSCFEGYELHTVDGTCIEINECEVDNGKCEHTCLNFMGTYTCLCPQGSILKADAKTCRDVSNSSVSSSVRLNVDNNTAITDKEVYNAIGELLEDHFQAVTDTLLSVFVNNLRQGSIIADYTAVYEDDQNVIYTADELVKAIIDLEVGGTLLLDGKSVEVQSILPVNYTDPCQLRESLVGQCEDGWYCEVDKNKPSCRTKSGDSDSTIGNTVTIAVSVVGCVFFVVLVVLLTIFIRYTVNKKIQPVDNS